MSSSSSACFVGIDVSKATLDVHLRPQAESWQIAYDSKHLAALIEKLQGLAPERLIVEATGGLETLLVSHLAAAALPVCVGSTVGICAKSEPQRHRVTEKISNLKFEILFLRVSVFRWFIAGPGSFRRIQL